MLGCRHMWLHTFVLVRSFIMNSRIRLHASENGEYFQASVCDFNVLMNNPFQIATFQQIYLVTEE